MIDSEKTRHLVLHDYGMGGLWWWVRARSAEETVLRAAEVEVITHPEVIARCADWALDEVDLDAPDPNPLSSLRARRTAHRAHPDFGKLAGRERVYLKYSENDYDGLYFLVELGSDGRTLRGVEVRADGTGYKTDQDDVPFNPPTDLHDPQYAPMETTAEAFHAAWDRAEREPEEG